MTKTTIGPVWPTFRLVNTPDAADTAHASIHRGADQIVEQPPNGRVFRTSRRVSIDDCSPAGRMECDAIARFLQDAGNDDTDDAGLDEFGLAWVARRATIEIDVGPQARELLQIATWCSGTGRRWAERSTQLRGDRGGLVNASVIWIHIDAHTGRPASWGAGFADNYLVATQGRRVDAKLRHSTDVAEDAVQVPWRFRATDMDAFGHVNNAAYLALVEQVWGEGALTSPARIEIEWRKPSLASEDLMLHATETQLWLTEPGSGELRVSATCTPLK